MEVYDDDIVNACLDAIKKKVKNLRHLNVMVLGKSGVGKSTLINSVFRENVAKVGIGKPVTKHVRRKDATNIPLSIWDTPGLELGGNQQDEVKSEILDVIQKGFYSNDINKQIHCIWYCINVGGNRTFDDSELSWIKELSSNDTVNNVPMIIVLTQAVPRAKADEMKLGIEKENLNVIGIVKVLAQDMDFDELGTYHSYGLNYLIDMMSAALPDELQDSIMFDAKGNLDAKKKYAQKIVATAVAGAFGEGFMPIPFSDCAVLIPTQVGMLAGITVAFGLDVDRGFLTCIVAATIGSGGATAIGKTVVSNLLKLIPGAGTAVGGMISGGTAGVLTTALGEAYIQLMIMICEGDIKQEDIRGKEGMKTMKDLFKTQLKSTSLKSVRNMATKK